AGQIVANDLTRAFRGLQVRFESKENQDRSGAVHAKAAVILVEPGQQHWIPVRGVYRGKLRLPRAQQRGEAPIITYRYVSHRAFHTEILRGESRPRRQRDRTVAGDGGNEQARGR